MVGFGGAPAFQVAVEYLLLSGQEGEHRAPEFLMMEMRRAIGTRLGLVR